VNVTSRMATRRPNVRLSATASTAAGGSVGDGGCAELCVGETSSEAGRFTTER
jgi:hypothetical protein